MIELAVLSHTLIEPKNIGAYVILQSGRNESPMVML